MRNRSFLAVLFSVLAGTIIWAIHFTIIYGFTSTACARGLGTGVVPTTVAVATVVAGLVAAVVMVRSLRRAGSGTPTAIRHRRRISSTGLRRRSPGWRWS